MSLEDKLNEAISGRDRYVTAGPRNTVGMTRALVAAYGSNTKAAKALGVSEAAIRRWLKGAAPRNRAGLVAGYRKAIVGPAREAALRAGNIVLVFDQDRAKHAGQRKPRRVDQNSLDLAPGTMDKVMDRYLAGDTKGAARELHSGIRNHWYSTHIVPDDDNTEESDYEGDYPLT